MILPSLPASPKKGRSGEKHVLHLYEDFSLSLRDVQGLIRKLTAGGSFVKEKIDGQNMTFTCDLSGAIKLLPKGAVPSSRGLGRDAVYQKFSDKPTLRDAYVSGLNALSDVFRSDPTIIPRFKDGRLIIEAAVISPENLNVVTYRDLQVRLIRATPLCEDLDPDEDLCGRIVDLASRVSGPTVRIDHVPTLMVRPFPSQDVTQIEITLSNFRSLVGRCKLTLEHTVGDLVTSLVREASWVREFPRDVRQKVASRIATGQKSLLGKNDLTPSEWRLFQEVELRRSTEVSRSIIPLERVVQDVGVSLLRNVKFEVASDDPVESLPVRQFVGRVRSARGRGRLSGTPHQMSQVDISLERIAGRENLFEKSAEGVILSRDGLPDVKFTGLFTPVNKLNGLFRYGRDPVRFLE